MQKGNKQMSKVNEKDSMRRYRIIAWVFVISFFAVVVRATYIMTFKRDY